VDNRSLRREEIRSTILFDNRKKVNSGDGDKMIGPEEKIASIFASGRTYCRIPPMFANGCKGQRLG